MKMEFTIEILSDGKKIGQMVLVGNGDDASEFAPEQLANTALMSLTFRVNGEIVTQADIADWLA